MFATNESSDQCLGFSAGGHADLIVVGGGLAGLTAAAIVARAGRSVLVLDKASHLGGRAMTNVREEALLNLGPHALYCHGHAFQLFQKMGITFTGAMPDAPRNFLRNNGRLHAIPYGLWGLLRSRLLTWMEKYRLVGILKSLAKMDFRAWDRVPLSEWIAQHAGKGNLAAMLQTLFRLTTYAADHEQLSAGAALEQFQIANTGSVWYLDGGWQSLVEGLTKAAIEKGAVLRTSAPARRVMNAGEGVVVELADGQRVTGATCILTVEPNVACKLLELPEDAPLVRWNANRIPVKAACLDLALQKDASAKFNAVFDTQNPFYYSNHSAVAKLAPEGVEVIHVAKYLTEGEEPGGAAVERELKTFVDQLRPQWKDQIVAERYLPSMLVACSLPRYQEGGLQGRPAVTVSKRPGIFLAGDWVGSRGMLADASAASAEESAEQVLLALELSEKQGHGEGRVYHANHR